MPENDNNTPPRPGLVKSPSGQWRRADKHTPKTPKPGVKREAEIASLYFSELEQRMIDYIETRRAVDAITYKRKGTPSRLTHQQIATKTGMSFMTINRLLHSRAKLMTFQAADQILRAVDISVADLMRKNEIRPPENTAVAAARYMKRMDDRLVELAQIRASVPLAPDLKRRWLAIVGGIMECMDALYTTLGVVRDEEGVVREDTDTTEMDAGTL